MNDIGVGILICVCLLIFIVMMVIGGSREPEKARLGTRWRCLVCDTLVWDTYDRCHYCGSKRGEH